MCQTINDHPRGQIICLQISGSMIVEVELENQRASHAFTFAAANQDTTQTERASVL